MTGFAKLRVAGFSLVALAVVGCSSGSGSSPASDGGASSDSSTSTPKTICEAQRSFDKRCGTSGQVDGGTCALSCFESLLTPAAASTFSECTANHACGGTTCGLGVPCTEAGLCSVEAGKAGLTESGLDLDAFVAKCEAKAKQCKVAFFTDPHACDADGFTAGYGPFIGLPAAVAACFDKSCDEIGPCVSKANAAVQECQFASSK